jgi:hypothetical protein
MRHLAQVKMMAAFPKNKENTYYPPPPTVLPMPERDCTTAGFRSQTIV